MDTLEPMDPLEQEQEPGQQTTARQQMESGQQTVAGQQMEPGQQTETGQDGAHVHEPSHAHTHAHNHPNQKAVSNRLARAIGHLEAVKRMVDNEEDCAQILIQMAAVRSAINNAGQILLMDHIDHCIVEAVQEGDMSKIEDLNEAIRKFL